MKIIYEKIGGNLMKRMIAAVNIGLIALVIVGTLAMVSITSNNMPQSNNLNHIHAFHESNII
jgi:hypothetical protein